MLQENSYDIMALGRKLNKRTTFLLINTDIKKGMRSGGLGEMVGYKL